MKFAIATSDSYQCVLEAFLRAGWQLEKLFVSPENWMYSNQQVIARALELGASVQQSPVRESDLAKLGCDLFVVSCYQWKIPPWEKHVPRAVNFHPSPLPEARGPYPYVRAILEKKTSWATTCHRISDKYDGGDILAAEHFPVDEYENHESLILKTQMAAGRLASKVATDLEALWNSAKPQGEGSYWGRWAEDERIIDFAEPVEAIMRKVRAFGDIECVAKVNGITVFIHRAKGWIEPHCALPGAVVHANNFVMVVAAADGYIAITEWGLHAPGAVIHNSRR
jgi:methionyl-tRNA formyltransferase